MRSTANEIAEILEIDKSNLFDPEAIIEHISIDSRSIYRKQKTLFIALDGNKNKGVDYVKDLYQQGVINFLIANSYKEKFKQLKANFFYVENPLSSLQKLVAVKRQSYKIEVIGVTGSNGKTIVKEWLTQLLNKSFSICKNPKSYNSQIGVPLSVWGLNSEHNLAIFEAGISKLNEMQALERMIQPTIGILTNIGDAHQINFTSKQEKLEEKLKLFIQAKILITSQKLVDEYKTSFEKLIEQNKTLELITWGNNSLAQIEIFEDLPSKILHIKYNGTSYHISLKYTDTSYVENLSHCLATLCILAKDLTPYIELIDELSSLEMRLEVLEGINNTVLINDTYNADLQSLTIALQYLFQNNSTSPKSIVLSEIMDVESQPIPKIIDLLTHKKIDQLVLIGKSYEENISKFETLDVRDIFYYDTASDFILKHTMSSLRGNTILLKGARKFEFENIVKELRQKTHSTYLRVHLNAIKNNLNVFARRLNPQTKVMIMLKAAGYGLGSLELAKILESQRVDYFAVAYTDEGIELRKAGIQKPIMVLNPEVAAFDKLVEYQLEPEIYSLSILKQFIEWLKLSNIQKIVGIHLKLETGMHRLGIIEEDILEVIEIISANDKIEVLSILSHLAASDEAVYDPFTQSQFDKFISLSNLIENRLGIKTIKHILNTGGILRHSSYQLDMVRLGIGLFGFDSTDLVQKELEATVTLVSKVSQIKEVKAGDTVGYSRNGKAVVDKKIAIINIGYADGYFRSFGNGLANVYIAGQYAPTIGNVCMDMIMVDITHCKNIQEGDEVELLGKHISIADLAKKAQTIPYEILTAISSRVQRMYWED